MSYIYHICHKNAWEAAQITGFYLGNERDQKDGFIHMSTEAQVRAKALKYYDNIPNLILLKLDSQLLSSHLKWEPNSKGEIFPHYYAKLSLNDIKEAFPFSINNFDLNPSVNKLF